MKTKLLPGVLLMLFLANPAFAADKPNIVLMVMDNLGWGELGTYGGGILRGAATAYRLDCQGRHETAQL